MDERKRVGASWDRIGRAYHANRDVHKIDAELGRVAGLLPAGGSVLDAGCGAGVPVARYLSRAGFKVTGVDISETMLGLARENAPEATFLKQDIMHLDVGEGTFDAVVCLFTLWHVPRAEHGGVIASFHRALKPGGLLVINTGTASSDGWSDFFGEPMLWSNHDPSTTLRIVTKSGFSIVSEGNLARGGELQYWVLARKA